MSLNDVAAAILLQNKKAEDLTSARDLILYTFKKEFPYWSFMDWNVEISLPVAKALLRIFEDDPTVTIKRLIVDLPPLAESFRKSS